MDVDIASESTRSSEIQHIGTGVSVDALPSERYIQCSHDVTQLILNNKRVLLPTIHN